MPSRPTMVDTGNGVQPAVPVAPVMATVPGTWRGFELEDLSLPAGELPPRATPLQHVICTVTSPGPITLHWREHGKEQQKTVHQGDMILRSQQELVDFRWDQPMDILVLGIGVETLRSVAEEMPGPSNRELEPVFGVRDPLLYRLMLALRKDLASGCPAGGLLGESICTAMAVYALERHSVTKPQLKAYRRGMPPERLKLVLDYIEANLGEELSIRRLAELAGMGLHYFRKLFSSSTGLSVHEYILQARISRARLLLQYTPLDIVQIALQVGFSSQSHFTAEFHRRLGATPAVYRSMVSRGIARKA